MEGWLDAADRQLARSIFGTDDRGPLSEWFSTGSRGKVLAMAPSSRSRSAWGRR